MAYRWQPQVSGVNLCAALGLVSKWPWYDCDDMKARAATRQRTEAACTCARGICFVDVKKKNHRAFFQPREIFTDPREIVLHRIWDVSIIFDTFKSKTRFIKQILIEKKTEIKNLYV